MTVGCVNHAVYEVVEILDVDILLGYLEEPGLVAYDAPDKR